MTTEKLTMGHLTELGFKKTPLLNYEVILSDNLILSVGNFPFNEFCFTIQVVDQDQYICSIQCPAMNTKQALIDFIHNWHSMAVDIE